LRVNGAVDPFQRGFDRAPALEISQPFELIVERLRQRFVDD
jgi:hypothetical protein